ncbi:MAG TPA: hypothetical protein VLB44_06415 [Kofleriaceae bacterium]|nr:hypothetical protein [Kofleriaceae bacterium]
MHLVEAEDVGPIEGDAPLVTPPRPPHRRVSVSFLFTMSILIGTVVAIYMLLPARHDVLLTEAIDHHRDSGPWDLENPSASELRAWAIGVVGKDVPLPPESAHVIGARRLQILRRGAALIRLQLGNDQITYLVQHARGIAPEHVKREDGDLHAESLRRGKFTIVAVGPTASSQTWAPALLGP